MSSGGSIEDHPFTDERVRIGFGLASGIMIAVFAVLFFEGIIMWFLIGFATLEVIITPYLLKQVVERAREHERQAQIE